MTSALFYVSLEGVVLLSVFFAIIYAFGIVWRVEKKLDLAFKLFLSSIISFAIFDIFSLFNASDTPWIMSISIIAKTLFALLFLIGILEMRSMIRKLDGEKK